MTFMDLAREEERLVKRRFELLEQLRDIENRLERIRREMRSEYGSAEHGRNDSCPHDPFD